MTATLNALTLHIDTVVAEALARIEARFERNPTPANNLAFHCVSHTRGVIRRTRTILEAWHAARPDVVTERHVALGILAAAGHDLVQEWEENRTADGKVLRKRFAGKNEEASAAEIIAIMRQFAPGVFTDEEENLVRDAIMATVPGWDPKAGTVFQPALKPDSHPVIRALAFADLGNAGMDGAVYGPEGDSLFREENLDIASAIAACATRNDLDADTQEAFRKRMTGWDKGQRGFAIGRRTRLEEELGGMPEEMKTATRILFNGFDAAIAAVEQMIADRQDMTFWQLAEAMGYR